MARYNAIYNTLREEITGGKYILGQLLPTESELADKYSVSRPTIAKAYNKLQKEGLIKKKKGAGSSVAYKFTQFGLLLPGAGESEIFSIINDRFLEQSKKAGFNCMWDGTTTSSAEVRKTLIENNCDNYIEKKVDGIFFSPLERVLNADQLNQNICQKIQDAHIPVVLIDRDIVEFPEKSQYDLVSLDNYNAGYVMAQHLADAGCEIIYYFYRPFSAYSVQLRLAGARTAIQEKNLPFNSGHVFCGNPEDTAFVKTIKIVPRKTGIICANDSTAAVLMSSLNDLGLRVSYDLLISGFDDMKYAKHLKRSLTSLQQPCEEIADVSIDLMMRRIKNPDSIPMSVQLPGKIIIRDSSKFI